MTAPSQSDKHDEGATPRTDRIVQLGVGQQWPAIVTLARQLERELAGMAAARDRVLALFNEAVEENTKLRLSAVPSLAAPDAFYTEAMAMVRQLQQHLEARPTDTGLDVARQRCRVFLERFSTPVSPLATPVEETDDSVGDWQCRDYGDGWITFPDRKAAEKYQEQTGAMMRYRRFYPAPSAVSHTGEPSEETLRAMAKALDPVIMGSYPHHKARLIAAYHAACSTPATPEPCCITGVPVAEPCAPQCTAPSSTAAPTAFEISLGAVVVDALQERFDYLRDWAKVVKIEFYNGVPVVRVPSAVSHTEPFSNPLVDRLRFWQKQMHPTNETGALLLDAASVIEMLEKKQVEHSNSVLVPLDEYERLKALSAIEPRIPPLDPTPAMVEAGAQRLVRWETGNEKWPDAWSKLDVRAARNDAERCWRSMWLEGVDIVPSNPPIPPKHKPVA